METIIAPIALLALGLFMSLFPAEFWDKQIQFSKKTALRRAIHDEKSRFFKGVYLGRGRPEDILNTPYSLGVFISRLIGIVFLVVSIGLLLNLVKDKNDILTLIFSKISPNLFADIILIFVALSLLVFSRKASLGEESERAVSILRYVGFGIIVFVIFQIIIY